MIEIEILVRLFGIALILNIVWEFSHSMLYETCLRQSWRKNVPLLLSMALKDAFFVTLFYGVTVFVFGNVQILEHILQLVLFLTIAIIFSFFDERISIAKKRWKYARTMPRIAGVGITPLFELALTGLATFFIVFR